MSGAELDHRALGEAMYARAAELFPVNRSLTGPGFRHTLAELEAVAGPMERHRFATGEAVLDWTVPKEWTLREGWIRDPEGRTVVSLADSNLHVMGYSTPVAGTFSLEELQPHLHSLPEEPDAIPYRTSYYQENWGFCLTDRQRRTLVDGPYEVLIDADLSDGHVEVGEVTIPGESESEVLLSTYCCHPSMANNELSGPVVASQLAQLVRERQPRPRLTYRFLFLPETIGAIAYLARFGDRLLERLVAGYVITCVGDRGPFNYKRSRRGASLADRVAEHVLGQSDYPYAVKDFMPIGSDERQYCSPGFDLPVGSLTRTPYHDYREYHTSLDDMSFITPESLGESLHLYERIVACLEANETLQATMPYGEPQLGRRGLLSNTGALGAVEQDRQDLFSVLNFCDGGVDLLSVADRIGRPLWALRPIADALLEHELLQRGDHITSPPATGRFTPVR